MTDKDKIPGSDPNASGQGDAGSDPGKTPDAPLEFDFMDGADLVPLHEDGEGSTSGEPETPAVEAPAVEPAAVESAAPAPALAPAATPSVPQKYCIVCHSLIPASARVCPVCSTKLALYEGTAHKQFWKFLIGFFLITLGCFMPWSEGLTDVGYQHLIGVFVLLVGLAGMWKMWVGLVANKFSLAPIGWAFLVFFWALYQVMTLANSFQMLARPDAKAVQTAHVRDLSPSELRELIRGVGSADGTAPAGEAAKANEEKAKLAKGTGAFFDALFGSFGELFDEEGDNLYSMRRNVAHWGMGRLIVFLGSTYIIWVFFASFLGMKKKDDGGSSGKRGGSGGTRSGASSAGRSAGRDKGAAKDKGKKADDTKDAKGDGDKSGRTGRRSARAKGDDAAKA